MRVQVIVTIDCSAQELRQGQPFVTASQFWRYAESQVTVRCEDGRVLTITASMTEGAWRQWEEVRAAWEVIHGSL